MTYWLHIHHLDERARALADRHYSRQSIGAREIAPPGNKIVLLGRGNDALWVSHRPAPGSGATRRDGFDYWDNPYFRNESDEIASDLIVQALAITVGLWTDALPADGFHSFVNPQRVRPTMRRGQRIYGYCFLKAGFELHEERTKSRHLLRFIYPLLKLLELEVMRPGYEQLTLWT